METEPLTAKQLNNYQKAAQSGNLPEENLRELLLLVISDDTEKTNKIDILKKINKQVSDDYQALNKKYEKLRRTQQKDEEEKKLGKRGTYGVKSEKLSDEEVDGAILKEKEDGQTDPLDDTASPQDQETDGGNPGGSTPPEEMKTSPSGKKTGKKKDKAEGGKPSNHHPRPRGSWEKDTKDLPQVLNYAFNVPEELLGMKYLSVVSMEKDERLAYHPAFSYKKVTYTVTYSFTEEFLQKVGDRIFKDHERRIYRAPHESYFLPGTHASEEIAAEFMYEWCCLFIPANRIEKHFETLGCHIFKQKILYWMDKAAEKYLLPVVEWYFAYLIEHKYIQSDETTWEVIMDGRKQGAKSYIWLHVTSEVLDCPKVAVYFFNRTRGESYLEDKFRELFAVPEESAPAEPASPEPIKPEPGISEQGRATQLAKLVVKDDAFAAYPELQKHSGGTIQVSFCLSHIRRPFFLAWTILLLSVDSKNMDDAMLEKLHDTPEWKILIQVSMAEREDTKLKHVSREERLKGRLEKVKPYLDKAHELVEACHAGDPEHKKMSITMGKAITYFRNCWEDGHVTNFLHDANIPADNSFCERNIRPIAQMRHSSLFSFSEHGAFCRMIIASVGKTALLNEVNPYLYYLYLLKEIPRHQHNKDSPDSYMPDMMPWAGAFKKFVEKWKEEDKTFINFDGLSGPIPEFRHGEWVFAEKEKSPA